ncbi:butyrophilin subfamily 2 member A2-like [Carettochelys insculpta]|uniref:butyrophilin subfamily 2 member A2-like n=1 Tax=Carettochelys insculpta TaxID=44489 RepID=UPI003EBE89D5
MRLEVDQLQMERVQFRNDCAKLWGKVDQQQREINALQMQRANLQPIIQQLQHENGQFQVESSSVPPISQLQNAKEELLVERDWLLVENNQLQKEKDQLREKCGWLRMEKNKLQRKICRLQLENGQHQLENDELRMGRAQLRKEKENLEKILGEMKTELEWRRVRSNSGNGTNTIQYDVTLHGVTAHPNISIAGDKKSLKHESQRQKVPPAPERFDSAVCVLGSQGFSSGKHYWEVDVTNSSDWDLGVARKSIQRKGKISLSPKEGFWTLGLSGTDCWAKTDPWTLVMVQKKLKKIGVYLSYQEGQVTFFNVSDMSVLFTFYNCSFSGEVYPFFKNSQKETTMRICSIKEE